ncbi:M48 family metallopeptidase [Gammaproteobacteria bacterium]|nr:M48 family metallopeptidase [Gammaproteobacteria bacterium]
MLWLNFRQKKSIQNSFNVVPPSFQKDISLKDHQKAGLYSLDKLKVDNFEILFSSLLLVLWTIGGGIDLINNFWASHSHEGLSGGVFVILSIMIISSLLGLPVNYFRTFKIEEKHGFNKSTTSLFFSDYVKQIIIYTLIFGSFISFVVLWLMNYMGQYWWIYTWAFISLFSLIMIWVYPTFIAPLFNKFSPLSDKELEIKIKSLITKSGFQSNGIFVMDGSRRSSHGNAYFTGMGESKRIVFFDTLLKDMSHDEIEAILAHELGHFHHKHIRKNIVSTFLATLIGLALLGYLIDQEWFFSGLGITEVNNHNALIVFTIVAPVFTFLISPISNMLSRKHEFEADNFAATHTDAKNLISSLIKLYKENASTLTPDKIYSTFHHSHPPASERIGELLKYAN